MSSRTTQSRRRTRRGAAVEPWRYTSRSDIFVSAQGLPPVYAAAMLNILFRTRRYYRRLLGAQSVGRIELRASLAPDQALRLWTNGADRIHLQLSSLDQLAPPSRGGARWVHGLAHELAHIAMYRSLLNLPSLPAGWGEGWAVYLASFWAVPQLCRQSTVGLWPQPYDYMRVDGPGHYLSRWEPGASSPQDEIVRLIHGLETQVGRRALAQRMRALLKRRLPAARFVELLQSS